MRLPGPLSKARAAVGLARVRWLNQRRPVIVSWAITHRCNLRCVYCDVPERRLPEASPAQALDLIDQMARLGTRAVSFNGGEPLLRKDIVALAERCRSHGMSAALSTNGTFLDGKREVLTHLDRLQISVDGPRKLHEAQRGEGTFDDVLSALSIGRGAGLPMVLSVVLTRHNVGAIDDLVAFADSQGASLSFLPVGPVHAFDVDYDSLRPTPAAMRTALREAARHARTGAPILGSASSFEYLAQWPAAPRIDCFGASGIAKLAADGRVFPCAILEHRTHAISALDHGFEAAWDAIAEDPLDCSGCHCTKTLQLNRVFWDTLSAIPLNRLAAR
ncbi:MAG: radical SAM protein [Proteobacteria bacterium]|nr:radical SAM protein [Pseudomonadota bacterium]